MEVIKKQRLAVCRILLDVVEGACEVRDPDLIMRTRHYPALQREMCFADRDWEEARDLSVLACLVLSKELHYKVKMMIGLVAHDLYSRESSVSYQQRLSFDVLMSAIDWPVSFKEITLFAPSIELFSHLLVDRLGNAFSISFRFQTSRLDTSRY